MGDRHILQTVNACGQWTDIALGRADLLHVQDHLRVLGIILVPDIVQHFAYPGKSDR